MYFDLGRASDTFQKYNLTQLNFSMFIMCHTGEIRETNKLKNRYRHSTVRGIVTNEEEKRVSKRMGLPITKIYFDKLSILDTALKPLPALLPP